MYKRVKIRVKSVVVFGLRGVDSALQVALWLQEYSKYTRTSWNPSNRILENDWRMIGG